MAKATIEDLKSRAESAIANDEDFIYDVASGVGQMVGNVRHMHWFKLAVMRALTEDTEKYSHLAEAVA